MILRWRAAPPSAVPVLGLKTAAEGQGHVLLAQHHIPLDVQHVLA